MKKKLKKGFTLVELVIVIAVIAILSAVLIPTFGNVIQNANDSAAFSTASNALTQYTTSMAAAQQSTDLPNGYVLVYDKDQEFNGSYDIFGTNHEPKPKYVFRFENGSLKQKDTDSAGKDIEYKFATVCGSSAETAKVVQLTKKYTALTNGKYKLETETNKGTAAITVADSKATYYGAYVLDGTIGTDKVTGKVLLVADVDTTTGA